MQTVSISSPMLDITSQWLFLTKKKLKARDIAGADPGFLKGGAYYKKVVF